MKEKLKQLIETIERAKQNLKDDKLFQEVIAQIFTLEVMTVREFAKTFGLSFSNVERWRAGLNVPHLALRPRTYQLLKAKTEEKLK